MADFLVNIDVRYLAKGEAFYSQAFGLKAGRRFGDAGVEMLGLAAPIYLLAKAAGSKAAITIDQVCDYGRHWTPVHLDIVVDDIDAAMIRAKTAGAILEAPVKSANWGKLALMSDPFGHGFCLVEFVNRGYDEIAT